MASEHAWCPRIDNLLYTFMFILGFCKYILELVLLTCIHNNNIIIMSINMQGDGTAYWSNTMSTRDHSITEDQLVKQIKFLVENIYIQVGNKFLGKR